MMAGKMPPARIPSRGIWVRNSHEMAGAPRAMMKITTAKIGRIVKMAMAVNPATPRRCFNRGFQIVCERLAAFMRGSSPPV